MISRDFFHFQICETFGNLGVEFSMTWLLIHRIEENKGKTTDDLVVNFPKDTTILSSLKKTLIQWTLSNSNSQGKFEFVRIMESLD